MSGAKSRPAGIRVARPGSAGLGDADQEAQERAIAAACRRRGWRPLAPSDRAANQRQRAGSAQAPRPPAPTGGTPLVAAKRERPARALPELGRLLASAQRQGWALVALQCALEPPGPEGEPIASLLASFAPCQRHSISQRTREALARARAEGVRLGRPPTMSPYVIERIRRERAAGKSLAAIAAGLNIDRVPTSQGGRRWYPATIRHTLNRTS